MKISSPPTNSPELISPRTVLRSFGNVQISGGLSEFQLSNLKSSTNAEVILDYSRCEGGFPFFAIASSSAPNNQEQVTFQVTYTETIDGLDDLNGDGPFFLFSNAMDSYRSCLHYAAVTNDAQTVKARHIQASQRYQKITLISPDSTITFSSIGFLPTRPQASINAQFRCSDETINHIWRDGVRTVDMCTVAHEETVPAWDIIDDGTRVYGGHWAPCKQGTRWSDVKMTFRTRVESYGASWAVRMITNGLIFCLDTRSRTLSLTEGLSNESCIIPSIQRGSWALPEDLDFSNWLCVETQAIKDRLTVYIDGCEVASVANLHVKAMLGNNLVNTGSFAFGGPPGWIAIYRDVLVRSLDGVSLYENSLLPRDAERTYADFQVGTNQYPCIIDGAKRDRACFGGDAFVTGRSIAYSTNDLDAWKGTIQLLISHQTQDGYLGNLAPLQAPLHTGNEDPPCYGHYSLTYALLLVVSIKDYWLHSGDRELVEKSFDQLRDQMEFVKEFLNVDGLVEAPPYLSMTWFPMGGPVFGVSTGLNLAYYDALCAMALMSSDKEAISHYRSSAAALKDSLVQKLWNREQGTMRPAMSLATCAVFQDVNAYAAILGVSPEHPAAVEGIFPSGEGLPPAFRNVDEWEDFELTSPYASGFALEALFRKNEGMKARDLLSRVWGIMADRDNPNYSGGHWEAIKTSGAPFSHDVSLVHGWSSWPVFLLPRYLAGVYPLEPGWQTIGVEPVFSGLEWVQYSLETPQGRFSVDYCIKEREGVATITLLVPEGISATVIAPQGWVLSGDGIVNGGGIYVSFVLMNKTR